MPSTKTSPDRGKSDALQRFASVDLPEPLWPSTTVLEPGFRVNETLSRVSAIGRGDWLSVALMTSSKAESVIDCGVADVPYAKDTFLNSIMTTLLHLKKRSQQKARTSSDSL